MINRSTAGRGPGDSQATASQPVSRGFWGWGPRGLVGCLFCNASALQVTEVRAEVVKYTLEGASDWHARFTERLGKMPYLLAWLVYLPGGEECLHRRRVANHVLLLYASGHGDSATLEYNMSVAFHKHFVEARDHGTLRCAEVYMCCAA